MKRQSWDRAKEQVLELFQKTMRPVLVGRACLHLGPLWTIAETEWLFCELESEGVIRVISPEERARFGVEFGYLLICPV